MDSKGLSGKEFKLHWSKLVQVSRCLRHYKGIILLKSVDGIFFPMLELSELKCTVLILFTTYGPTTVLEGEYMRMYQQLDLIVETKRPRPLDVLTKRLGGEVSPAIIKDISKSEPAREIKSGHEVSNAVYCVDRSPSNNGNSSHGWLRFAVAMRRK